MLGSKSKRMPAWPKCNVFIAMKYKRNSSEHFHKIIMYVSVNTNKIVAIEKRIADGNAMIKSIEIIVSSINIHTTRNPYKHTYMNNLTGLRTRTHSIPLPYTTPPKLYYQPIYCASIVKIVLRVDIHGICCCPHCYVCISCYCCLLLAL